MPSNRIPGKTRLLRGNIKYLHSLLRDSPQQQLPRP